MKFRLLEYNFYSINEAIDKVGNEVGNKVGNLSPNQQKIVEQIKLDNKISATKLSQIVGISKRKIEENLAKLKEMKVIDRIGGTRGFWEVVGNEK